MKKTANKRFKNLKYGECFVHKNDIFIKVKSSYNAAVNLKTGEQAYFTPFSRVFPIKLSLEAVFDKTNKVTIPFFEE